MKHRDRTDIVPYVLAVTLSVLLGAGLVFLLDPPPSVDSSQSTAVSESARKAPEKTVSVPSVLAAKGVSHDPRSKAKPGSPGGSPKTPKSKTEATPIELKGVEAFDPPPGDGQEHSDEVAFAVDGDPTTTWSTEHYSGGLTAAGKDGVGLGLDADGAVRASELGLKTNTPGWSGEVYAANQRARDLAGWGGPVGSITKASADETVSLELSEPARYYLVWITDLGNDDTVELSEIRLLR